MQLLKNPRAVFSKCFWSGTQSVEVFSACTPNVCIFIYRLYTCSTVLIYYVHYKTYTKIEIKKRQDKIKNLNSVYFIFVSVYSTKKYFLLAPQWIVLCTPWHPMLETPVLGPMKGSWYEVHIWASRQRLASRTVVICVQLCQTAAVQTQKENFCQVAWLYLPWVLPDPDQIFSCDEKQYVHLLLLCSLSSSNK